jgi:hypothetical protein
MRHLESVERHGHEPWEVLPFGVPQLDEPLPHGGLTRGHLHEAIEAGAASQHVGLSSRRRSRR